MSIEYVEVTTKHPLWRSIPPGNRLDVAALKNSSWTEHARKPLLERTRAEILPGECEIAVKSPTGQPDKWVRCAWKTSPNANRCPRHGGPRFGPESRKTVSKITAERDALAARVKELEQQIGSSDFDLDQWLKSVRASR